MISKYTRLILVAVLFLSVAFSLRPYRQTINSVLESGSPGQDAQSQTGVIFDSVQDDFGAYQFDQTKASTYIVVPDLMDIESILTITFRIKYESNGTLISVWETTQDNRSFIVAVDSQSRLVFSISETGKKEDIRILRSRSTLEKDRWYDCAVTADGQALKIFINGYNDSADLVFYNGKIRAYAPGITIGDSSWFGQFKGTIENILIYNKSLDQKSLLQLAGQEAALNKLGTLENLLYFSFATPFYGQLTQDHLKTIDNADFTGVCVRLTGAYKTQAPVYEDFEDNIREIQKMELTKIWPVVFFNRFFGSPLSQPCEQTMLNVSKFSSYARQSNGLDLFDSAGTWSDLKNIFGLALRISKETQSPGVFIDPEAYNCYDAYSISYLAEQYGIAESTVIQRLMKIGAELADICDTTHPNAMIFFYLADIGIEHHDGYQKSITYIVEGILDRAKTKQYPLKVVDGWTGRYVYKSLAQAKHISQTKLAKKADYLNKYPNLEVAGVIAPFESYINLPEEGWMQTAMDAQKSQGEGDVEIIEDFLNIYDYLFSTFKHVWFYGATEAGPPAGYDIFFKELPQSYSTVLDKALKNHDDSL
ncbi:MAG: hypothetical protein GY729_17400 [Desulfobacteraceae bacterium]|nr:hypothetical protein [Desulfobacteraceae bacterium]